MRPTRRLLATAAAGAGNGGAAGGGAGGILRPAPPMALLPPIPLYRRILRSHRKHLPPRMRLLGDEYVKAEFRAHRQVDNPAHLVSLCLPTCLPTLLDPGHLLEKCSRLRVGEGSGLLIPHRTYT